MDPDALAEHLRVFLGSLPLPGRELSSADVEAGQRSRQALLDAGPAAVPVLLDRMGDDAFHTKDAAYRLILALDAGATNALIDGLGQRGPVVDLWIAGVLDRLGEERARDVFSSHLQDADPYARHLAALAIAFRESEQEGGRGATRAALPALIESLGDARSIEGAPFTVAGSALACLTELSEGELVRADRPVHFYNFDHFAYPPPTHPFPFAADHLTKAPPEEQRTIRRRVEEWARREEAR